VCYLQLLCRSIQITCVAMEVIHDETVFESLQNVLEPDEQLGLGGGTGCLT